MKLLLLLSLTLLFISCASSQPEPESDDYLSEEETTSVMDGDDQLEEENPDEYDDTVSTPDPVDDSGTAPDEEIDDEIIAATPAEITEDEPLAVAPPVVAPPTPAKKYSKAKGATRRLKSDCKMRTRAHFRKSSKTIRIVKKGRKLWTVDGGARFYKVLRKKGAGYLSKSCFNR